MAMIPWDNDIQTLAKAIHRVMNEQARFGVPPAIAARKQVFLNKSLLMQGRTRGCHAGHYVIRLCVDSTACITSDFFSAC